MSSWKGKTRWGVLGYKIFVCTLKQLRLSFAYSLLLFVVTYFIFSSRKVVRFIYSHLQEIRQAPERCEIIAMHGDRFIEGNTGRTINPKEVRKE